MAGSDNRLKIPVVRSLNQIGGQRGSDQLQSTAKGIPATVVSRNGQIVTVSYEMQTGNFDGPWTLVQSDYPISTAQTDWLPINKGVRGWLVPSDFYLGGQSGQGGGTADYAQRGNLATLVFVPLSNTQWTPPGGDTDKRALQGPTGVFAQDDDGKCQMTIDTNNGFMVTFAGHTFAIKSDGIYLDGIKWETHEHFSQVPTGTNKTGGPTNP